MFFSFYKPTPHIFSKQKRGGGHQNVLGSAVLESVSDNFQMPENFT